MIPMLAATLVVTLLAFTGIWLIHVKTRDAGYVDFYWGPGFTVIAAIYVWWYGFTPASAIVTLATAAWSVRLLVHLVARHRKSAGEDARYAAMRQAGGASYWWKSLFTVFLLQGALLWIIATPIHVLFTLPHTGSASGPLFIFGLALFAAGFAVEWVADRQLAASRQHRHPHCALLTSGLWSLCRHPNYLGEMLLWTGIGMAVFSLTQSPYAFAGPLVLIAVMRFITIPITEDHLQASRQQYAAYKARTPMLLPRLALRRNIAAS